MTSAYPRIVVGKGLGLGSGKPRIRNEHGRAAHSPAVQTPGPNICPQGLIVAFGVLATVGLGVLETSK